MYDARPIAAVAATLIPPAALLAAVAARGLEGCLLVCCGMVVFWASSALEEVGRGR